MMLMMEIKGQVGTGSWGDFWHDNYLLVGDCKQRKVIWHCVTAFSPGNAAEL